MIENTKLTLQMKVTFFIIRVQNLMLVFKTYKRSLPQRNITQHLPQMSEIVNFFLYVWKRNQKKTVEKYISFAFES